MCTGMSAGAVCLKKPHHIVTLQFSEVVKDHAKWMKCSRKISAKTTISDSYFGGNGLILLLLATPLVSVLKIIVLPKQEPQATG